MIGCRLRNKRRRGEITVFVSQKQTNITALKSIINKRQTRVKGNQMGLVGHQRRKVTQAKLLWVQLTGSIAITITLGPSTVWLK